MKKKISLVILFIALVLIICLTYFALTYKGIRVDINKKNYQTIEEISENITNEEASTLYNIYLNKERHKLKVAYDLEKEEDITSLKVFVYLDGTLIFNDTVIDEVSGNVNEIWVQDKYYNYFKLKTSDFKIITSQKNDYLVFRIAKVNNSISEYYYVINASGDILNEEAILRLDTSKIYVNKNGKALNVFYDDNLQVMAKVEDNVIYALIPNDHILEEYKIKINNEKIVKELENTYEVKLK